MGKTINNIKLIAVNRMRNLIVTLHTIYFEKQFIDVVLQLNPL